jgi:hypothetical protein
MFCFEQATESALQLEVSKKTKKPIKPRKPEKIAKKTES